MLHSKAFKGEKTQKGSWVPLQLFWVELVFLEQLKQHMGKGGKEAEVDVEKEGENGERERERNMSKDKDGH